MDDPLFEESGSEETRPAPAKPNGEAPSEEAPAAAPPQDDGRVARLEAQVERLVGTLNNLATTPAPEAPAPPRLATDELNDLAADPQGYVTKAAREAASAAIGEAVNPLVMRTLDIASQQLLGSHSQRVNQEFGAGTWEEVFKPQLESDLGRLREVNAQALGDPATIDALVNRLYGGSNFTKLVERREAHQKSLNTSKEEGIREIISHLPQGGVPRLRKPGAEGEELPEDVDTFLKEVDRATGAQTDRKRFGALYATGQDTGRGHRTDVVEYLKAVGADPETIKDHGG